MGQGGAAATGELGLVRVPREASMSSIGTRWAKPSWCRPGTHSSRLRAHTCLVTEQVLEPGFPISSWGFSSKHVFSKDLPNCVKARAGPVKAFISQEMQKAEHLDQTWLHSSRP